MKRSTLMAGVALFAILGLAGGGLAFYKKSQIDKAASAPPPPEYPEAVEIVDAAEMPWYPTAQLVGTVIARRSIMVSNELAGVVREVGFDSGSEVQEGQLLLKLDDTVEQADLRAAQAAVQVAEANVAAQDTQLQLAEVELRRLSTTGAGVAELEIDRARTRLDALRAEQSRWRAEVDQAKAQVAQVEARIAKMTITAPFRARAGMRTVHEGQYLGEGTQVVGLQEITDTIYLDFPIPQEYAPRVAPGVAVMATGELLGPEPVRIEVAAVDATVNNDTRNLRVRAVVDNREGRLRPGMFVRIEVPVDTPRNYVVVPVTAIRRAPYADAVYVAVPDDKGALRAQYRNVKVGASLGDRVIIEEGVKAGEKVIAGGSFKLREGAMVSSGPPGGGQGGGQPGSGGGDAHADKGN